MLVPGGEGVQPLVVGADVDAAAHDRGAGEDRLAYIVLPALLAVFEAQDVEPAVARAEDPLCCPQAGLGILNGQLDSGYHSTTEDFRNLKYIYSRILLSLYL